MRPTPLGAQLSAKRTEVKAVSYEEAVSMVRHSPFKDDRRDIIVQWGFREPLWHWSRRTDLTLEKAVEYHLSLHEPVVIVEEKVTAFVPAAEGGSLQGSSSRASKSTRPASRHVQRATKRKSP